MVGKSAIMILESVFKVFSLKKMLKMSLGEWKNTFGLGLLWELIEILKLIEIDKKSLRLYNCLKLIKYKIDC